MDYIMQETHEINWFKQIKAFYKLVELTSLSSNAQTLYNYLLYKDNDLGWLKEFTLSNLSICGITGLNKKALDRARNELVQKGFIIYKKGNVNQAGKYLIVDFTTQNVPRMSHRMSHECPTRCPTRCLTDVPRNGNIN